MSIYFRFLTEDAYIQSGNYTVTRQYNENAGNFIYYSENAESQVDMPSSFAREWATITSTEYDWGAYGIGVRSDNTTITLPGVEKRSLLYMYDIRGTSERRTLVQSSRTQAQLISDGIIGSGGSVVFNTFEEYVETFIPAGRYDFGGSGTPVLPANMSVSNVSELYSYNATIDGVNLNEDDPPVAQPVQLYVSPTWIGNERPLFDQIYFAADQLSDATSGTTYVVNSYQDLPIRQVRWLGGVPSETIAPINRSGDALDYSNSSYTYTDSVQYDVDTITENGTPYSNADSYTVVDLERQ